MASEAIDFWFTSYTYLAVQPNELFWGDDRLDNALSWHRHGKVV
jgi:hypothetical protein